MREHQGRRRLEALGVAVLSFVAVLATAPDYGMVWDEPYYLASQDDQRQWFRQLARDPGAALSARGIESGWHRSAYHNPHPPFAKVISNLGRWAFAGAFDPLTAHRAGSAAFFAGAAGLLYLLGCRSGRWCGLLAAALWGTAPRTFADAHFATTDTPITFFAVAVVAAGLRLADDGTAGSALLLGAAVGAAIATKFTGFLLPLPLVLWWLVRWLARRALPPLRGPAIAAGAASVSAWLLVPYWWHHPLAGPLELVRQSLRRGDWAVIDVAAFGRVYQFDAPFYLPWVMVAVAVPVGLWAPAILRMAWVGWARRGGSELLYLLAALVPLGLVALPSAPKHDGIRLFLFVLPFFALLSAAAWIAAARFLARWLAARGGLGVLLRRPVIAPFAFAAVVLPQAWALAVYHPLEASYYNWTIGGLRGAARAGMELSPFMDALTPPVLRDLEALLPEAARVYAPVGDPFYFETLQRLGLLRPDLAIGGERAPFLLVVSRVSVLGPELMRTLAAVPPAYAYELDGVPMVRLYAEGALGGLEGGAPAPPNTR